MEEAAWLEEMLRCPVCHDLLADPRQLPCGHSMCLSCVEKLLAHSSSGAPLRCPDCRTDFGPVEEVGLQRSYTLSSIAEDFRLNHETRERRRRSVHCDYCPDGTTPASRTCLKCEVSLCKEHVKDHLELPALTGHPLVEPLGDLGERKCRWHDDQVLRYYCTSSRRYVCNICALEGKQLNAAADASSVLRRQLTEYMDQHFEMLQGQVTDFTASLRKLQDDIQHEKLRLNPADSRLNGVTVVLLFLWFIVLYYAYNFSVENQTLTEALTKQQNSRSPAYPPAKEHLLKQLHNLLEEYQGAVPLDVDTPRCCLGVSDSESVKPKRDCLQSERCSDDDASQVVSTQCFSSGTHVWEVEAEGHWDISVFSESVRGQGESSSTFGNNSETWSLKRDGKGNLSACHNKTRTLLAATPSSGRIAVVVNFEEGRIVFSAVDFAVTQLHEFKAELTQPACLNVGVRVGDAHSRASIVKTA